MIWRVQVDAEQVARQAVSQRPAETAVDAGRAVPRIAVPYVLVTAREDAIQPARRFAIMGAQTNALVANEPAPTIVQGDANTGARPAAKILVRGAILHAQLPAPTIVQGDAREDAILLAHTTA